MLKFAKLIVLAGLMPGIVATAATVAATTEAASPFTISKETTAILGPVRADGSLDYVAALNERLSEGVTPENNGFVLWLRLMGPKGLPQSITKQTLGMCGAEAFPATAPSWTGYDNDTPTSRGPWRMWEAKNFPKYAAYLTSEEEFLTDATQAGAKSQWWAPAVSTDGALTMVLLPQLNQMRGVALELCDRALLRAAPQAGDFDGFLSDVMTVKRLSRHASGSFVINDLVAIGIDNLGNRAIAVAAGSGTFSRDQCAELAKAMDGMEPLRPAWESVDLGERWTRLEWAELIAVGKLDWLTDGSPDGGKWPKVFKAVKVDSVDWDAVLKQANADCDEMVDIMKINLVNDQRMAWLAFDRKMAKAKANKPTEAKLAMRLEETKEEYTQRVTDALRAVLLPSLSHVQNTWQSNLMQEKMARAVVAAAEFRADKGKWPDGLADLTPDYLPEAPQEVFATDPAKPVRYQKTSRGICLHARGASESGSPDIALGAE